MDQNLNLKNSCRFCNPPDKQRIIYESEQFYIMLSLGPLTEGYLLLVSKAHFDCCAALPEEYTKEFDYLYKAIQTLLIKEYGNVITYEHGRAGSCLVLSDSLHCYHAHMHFIPLVFAINNVIADDFSGTVVKDLNEFRAVYQADKRSYLFADDGRKTIYFPHTPVIRQYLRTLVASHLGNDEAWDWATYQNWPLIEAGRQKLTLLINNYITVDVIK